jgi:hypothetical protein
MIRPSADITKNGTGDIAVMGIETYELLAGKRNLYSLLDAGIEQVKQGKTKPADEVISSIRAQLGL